jgi:hypothetical protein
MTDLRKNPDVQTGIRLALLDMLYDKKITIPEFKEYCSKNGIDYEQVEHCCGCAGCVDVEEGSLCPDFENEKCKIIEPKYCHICGKKAEMGYPLTDKDNRIVEMFWACHDHSGDKKLESQLRKGISTERIIKMWNK